MTEARNAKVYENQERTKALHEDKMRNSAYPFKDARITSCSGVLLRNGKAVCVAFANPNPKPLNINA